MATKNPPPEELVTWLRRQCSVDADSKYARDDLYASCVQRFGSRYTRTLLGHAVASTFTDVRTRRIGVRGQSRYTYVGLRAQRSEPKIQRSRLRRTVGLRVPADPEAARRFVRRVTAEIEELERAAKTTNNDRDEETVEHDSDS
jgi:hypothetical protein